MAWYNPTWEPIGVDGRRVASRINIFVTRQVAEPR